MMTYAKHNLTRILMLTPLALALAACSVGPDYVRPQTAAVPVAFKEMKDWKPAQPNELAMNGKWWEMFGDPQLNALVEQIDISNQNLAPPACWSIPRHSLRPIFKPGRAPGIPAARPR